MEHLETAMIAITVAYRDRREHLEQFAPHMHGYLGGKDYEIYVIEQEPGRRFNRGKLFNVAYDLIDAGTFVFHDVDMLPQNAIYREVDGPEHWCGTATQFDGGRPYETYFGGVSAFDPESFETVNGFSNEYWGWGAEDDDLYFRLQKESIDVTWRDFHYQSLNHPTDSHNHDNLENIRDRYRAFRSGDGYDHQEEGLNTLEYEVLNHERVLSCHKTTVSI